MNTLIKICVLLIVERESEISDIVAYVYSLPNVLVKENYFMRQSCQMMYQKVSSIMLE